VGTTTIKTDGTTQLVLNRADASIQSGNQIANLLVTGDDPSAGQSGAAISFTAGDAWATNSYPTNIVFYNDNSGTLSPRMTLTSAGNLLVGQTSASSNTVGTSLRSDGRNFYCADGNYSGHFNRKTSDGAIVHFAKDDTIIGSISSRGGLTLGLILNPTSGSGAGLSGTSNAIFPIDETTTPVNGEISLGTTSNAFKDLYLSGGVYTGGDKFVYSYAGGAIGQVRSGLKLNGTNNQLEFYTGQAERMRIESDGTTRIKTGSIVLETSGTGVFFGGTTSANKLDAYEESNFTATLRGSSAEPSTLITATGFATKIGRVVQYSIGFENVNTTGYAGNFYITGLPFINNGARAIGNIVGYNGLTFGGTQSFSVIGVNQALLEALSISSASTWATSTHNAGTTRYFWLTGTYMTTA